MKDFENDIYINKSKNEKKIIIYFDQVRTTR